MRFEVGRTYHRRNDIHSKYGGQQQGGISTPSDHPIILLFSGKSGHAFGYADGWNEDGVFQYCGEGQRGNMQFLRGNKTIRDQAINGKEIHLFETIGKGKPCRYVGEFVCATWDVRQLPDVDGNERSAIVFHLLPINDLGSPQTAIPASGHDLDQMRNKALSAASAAPSQASSARATVYQRSKAVRDYVLARADGVCESCGKAAPFVRADGSGYLEPHHTRRLSDGGPDHPRWVGAVCPNCHSEIHHGAMGEALNQSLQDKLDSMEGDEPVFWKQDLANNTQ